LRIDKISQDFSFVPYKEVILNFGFRALNFL